MDLFPRFENIVTHDWLHDAFKYGTFDKDHGSDLSELCSEIHERLISKNISIPEDAQRIPDFERHEHWFYQEKILKHLEKQYVYICEQIQKSEFLTIYRKMNVDQKFIDNLSKCEFMEIGVYYSEDEYQDVAYWKKEEKEFDIRLKCEVERENVNWIETIRARMDWMTGDYEQEIRLKEYVPVHVIGWAGEDDDINENITHIKRWHTSGRAGQLPEKKKKENVLEF